MAFSATTVWNVTTGGADGTTGNGGGFDPANASMATDLAATNANTASPVVTSASYTFIARDVGHWVYVKSGTNWTPGWYQIASVAGGAATLSAAAGAAFLAAITPSTLAGCATVASPSGGTWAVDYSIGTPITYTDLAIDAVTNTDMVSALQPFGVNFVGNILAVSSGTGFTVQRVQIVSIQSSIIARCDKSLGTLASTGGNAKLGGPLASPGQYGALKVAGNEVLVKSGTYTISVNTANVANGKMSFGNGVSSANPSRVIGYQTVPGDNGAKPLFQLQAALASGITVLIIGALMQVENIEVDANSNTSSTCFSATSTSTFFRCKASRAVTGFNLATSGSKAILCYATTCSTAGFTGGAGAGQCFGCVARACTNTGFNLIDELAFCISASNTGSPGHGFLIGADYSSCINCIAFGNAGAGFTGASLDLAQFINCISVNNTGAGITSTTANSVTSWAIHCALYGNGSAVTGGILEFNTVTLTADPFTNSGSGDFSLNDTAGAGAECKAAGFPGVMPDGLSTGYLDIGSIQSDAGGGSGGTRSHAAA